MTLATMIGGRRVSHAGGTHQSSLSDVIDVAKTPPTAHVEADRLWDAFYEQRKTPFGVLHFGLMRRNTHSLA